MSESLNKLAQEVGRVGRAAGGVRAGEGGMHPAMYRMGIRREENAQVLGARTV